MGLGESSGYPPPANPVGSLVTAASLGCTQAYYVAAMRDGIFLLRPLPEQVFERAGQLSGQTTSRPRTRTVDLLHVAVALELAAECLYSFDQQQPAARQMRRVAFFCNCRKKYHLDAGYQGPLNVTGAMESLGSP